MKTGLQKVRKAAGFKSAKDFADFMSINVNTYTGYEQGKTFTLEQAWLFADALGEVMGRHVSLDELAGRPFDARVSFSDPRQEELNRSFEALDPERQDRLVSTAHDMEAARHKGDAAIRPEEAV